MNIRFTKQNWLRFARAALFVAPVCAFLWLGWQYFAVAGNLKIRYDFSYESPFIGEWEPRGRAFDREQNLRTGETYQQIVGEPVYLPVTVPRSYNDVDVTLEYRNESQPLVELGIVNSEEPFAVRLSPFESLLIDEALETWHQTTDERGITLLQKEQQFDTIADFEANLPQDKNVVTYQYVPPVVYTAEDSSQESTEETPVQEISPFLRGRHEFVTYVTGGELFAEFDTVDMNREFNEDIVRVEVKNAQGAIMYDNAIADDGDVTASAQPTRHEPLTVQLSDIPDGVYTLTLPVTGDIVTTTIRTTAQQFVAKNRLAPIRNEEYRDSFPNMEVRPTIVWTNADVLTVQALHPSSFQELTIGTDALTLDTVNQPEEWVGEIGAQEVQQLQVPVNNVSIQGHAYFSFSEEAFFDPDYKVQPLTQHTTLDAADYILFRNYTPVEDDQRGTRTKTVNMTFDGVFGDRKELLFALSAPGIDRAGNMIQINELEFTFHREPLHRRILNRLSR